MGKHNVEITLSKNCCTFLNNKAIYLENKIAALKTEIKKLLELYISKNDLKGLNLYLNSDELYNYENVNCLIISLNAAVSGVIYAEISKALDDKIINLIELKKGLIYIINLLVIVKDISPEDIDKFKQTLKHLQTESTLMPSIGQAIAAFRTLENNPNYSILDTREFINILENLKRNTEHSNSVIEPIKSSFEELPQSVQQEKIKFFYNVIQWLKDLYMRLRPKISNNTPSSFFNKSSKPGNKNIEEYNYLKRLVK